MDEACQHATLVRVHRQGVLIRGAPGTGKSRLALECIHQGHALIADDLVLTETRQGQLYGHPAESHQGQLALRGVGIITLDQTFGPAAVAPGPQPIHWVVELGQATPSSIPEHGQASIAGLTLPCLRLQAHSQDATLIALCCRLGSEALHRWKTSDVD